MPGNRIGGLKAREKNYERHGKDFYRRIGRKGGLSPTSKPKGFAANRELARKAGVKGGRMSRRSPVKGAENGRD